MRTPTGRPGATPAGGRRSGSESAAPDPDDRRAKRLPQTSHETPGGNLGEPDFHHVHAQPGTRRNPLPGSLPPPHAGRRPADPASLLPVHPFGRKAEAAPPGLYLDHGEGGPLPGDDVQLRIAAPPAGPVVPRHHAVPRAAQRPGRDPFPAGSESEVWSPSPERPAEDPPPGNHPRRHDRAPSARVSRSRAMPV